MAVDLAKELIPPHDADPERVYRWRVILAGVVLLMAGGLSAHIAMACGLLPMFFPGFASAAEVKDLATVQQIMRKEQLADSLYNMKRDQCNALFVGNLQAAETQEQRIREKIETYRQLSGGQVYQLPPCELFVSKR